MTVFVILIMKHLCEWLISISTALDLFPCMNAIFMLRLITKLRKFLSTCAHATSCYLVDKMSKDKKSSNTVSLLYECVHALS